MTHHRQVDRQRVHRRGVVCSQNGYLSSRGGCQSRWHSLVNCDHSDSTGSRFDSPMSSARKEHVMIAVAASMSTRRWRLDCTPAEQHWKRAVPQRQIATEMAFCAAPTAKSII
jgi:hypothetical protein